MLRRLSCGLVALVTLPLISAGPAPATQPEFVQAILDMDRQLDQAQADLSAAKSELDELSKLPAIQPCAPPSTSSGQASGSRLLPAPLLHSPTSPNRQR